MEPFPSILTLVSFPCLTYPCISLFRLHNFRLSPVIWCLLRYQDTKALTNLIPYLSFLIVDSYTLHSKISHQFLPYFRETTIGVEVFWPPISNCYHGFFFRFWILARRCVMSMLLVVVAFHLAFVLTCRCTMDSFSLMERVTSTPTTMTTVVSSSSSALSSWPSDSSPIHFWFGVTLYFLLISFRPLLTCYLDLSSFAIIVPLHSFFMCFKTSNYIFHCQRVQISKLL